MFPTATAHPRNPLRRLVAKVRHRAPLVGWSAIAILIGLVAPASLAVMGVAACNTIRSGGSTAVKAFIDCETPAIADVLPDLLPFGRAELDHLMDPTTNQVDPTKLLADLANVKSDLGRCAIAAAFALLPAASLPATPTHAVGLVQPATHTVFDLVHEQLHWPAIHVSGRVM